MKSTFNSVNSQKPKGNMYTLNTQSLFEDIILQEMDTSDNNLHLFNVITQKYPLVKCRWLQISAFKKNVSLASKFITIFKIVNINAKSKTTIVYSHGISVNLDKVFPFLIDLSSMLRCCIICYDYSDYDNKYSIEDNLSNDLETVINFAMDFFKINLSDMILLSSSFGSIPTFSICAKERFKKIRGLITVSPLSYGSCIYNKNASSKSKIELSNVKNGGIYTNQLLAENIHIPTFIIHGKHDRIIPYKQSINLCKIMSNANIWTPKNGTHNNIFTDYRYKFFDKIKKFILELSKIYSDGKNNSKVSLEYDNKRPKVSEMDLGLNDTSFYKPLNEINVNKGILNTSLDCIDFNVNTKGDFKNPFEGDKEYLSDDIMEKEEEDAVEEYEMMEKNYKI